MLVNHASFGLVPDLMYFRQIIKSKFFKGEPRDGGSVAPAAEVNRSWDGVLITDALELVIKSEVSQRNIDIVY